MEAFRLQNDLESLVSLTVQMLDAARSGNPALLDQSTAQRETVVRRLEDIFKNQSVMMTSESQRRWMDSIVMVQNLDQEIKSLVAYQHAKTKSDLSFLENLKKDLFSEHAVEGKGQRLKTQG